MSSQTIGVPFCAVGKNFGVSMKLKTIILGSSIQCNVSTVRSKYGYVVPIATVS